MFSVLSSKMEHKKLLKTEHQCKTSVKLAKKKKIKVHFWPNYGFILILRPHFQNSFFSQFFCYVFCAKLKDRTLKSYWKQNTSLLLFTSWILKKISNFGQFCCFAAYFLLLKKKIIGSEVCLERCDSYSDFGLLKNQTFLFQDNFVKEHNVLLL